MKRARQWNHSFPSSRGAREFDRALHRFGPGVAKEDRVEVLGRAFGDRFGEQTAQQRAIHLHHVRKIEIEHVADRLFHQGMVSADIENAVAAQEIEIRRVIHVVEIRALGPGIDLVETDHALRLHQRAIQMLLVQLVILAQTRGDDLLQIKTHETKSFRDLRDESNWVDRVDPNAIKRVRRTRSTYKKAAGSYDPAALNSRTYVRLIFHFNVFNHACLAGARVVNAHAVLRR